MGAFRLEVLTENLQRMQAVPSASSPPPLPAGAPQKDREEVAEVAGLGVGEERERTENEKE